ncbi:DUF5994 family protein [Nonomuraea jabiensis]|uniref:DUF5994 family protein n=1 Tax=Nonomuraea jabiensis TaxID=882448 RepID=UPI003674CF1A
MPNRHPAVKPIALQQAQVFLEPTLPRDGTLDGAWWPHSSEFTASCPPFLGRTGRP